MERFSIGDACEILVGRGLATTAESWRDLDGRRAVVVTQPGAADTARRVSAQMRCAAAVTTHMLPDGEPAKTLQSLQGVFATCVDAGLGRGDLVVAVGGGTVSDVAGFAAATYLRGVAWIAVPTTLLAAVDAAIGGKTGVNF
ncbi:MAG: iron-containing alcohol dehydrogenase, partial [Acidimicrobiia bacterium]